MTLMEVKIEPTSILGNLGDWTLLEMQPNPSLVFNLKVTQHDKFPCLGFTRYKDRNTFTSLTKSMIRLSPDVIWDLYTINVCVCVTME